MWPPRWPRQGTQEMKEAPQRWAMSLLLTVHSPELVGWPSLTARIQSIRNTFQKQIHHGDQTIMNLCECTGIFPRKAKSDRTTRVSWQINIANGNFLHASISKRWSRPKISKQIDLNSTNDNLELIMTQRAPGPNK